MTANLLHISLLAGIPTAIALAAIFLFARYRRVFMVYDGFAGLLYRDGKLAETLAPGRHARYGRNLSVASIDLRQTLLQVPGQEVLTADNVAVKASIVLTLQIVDAARSVQVADNATMHLYNATQTALRSVVAGVTLEALLAQRAAIGPQLRELLAPQAEALGVQVRAAEVRDVMLPGDLRKAFSEVLKIRQEGQAALERARSESAALRNLANAARLVEGLPALVTLRLLQTLENTGQTVVMNDLSALLATTRSRSRSSTEPEAGET
jgi:regulator of protease activity HflC (stomatin/prohibitin superfamily)